MMNEIKVSIVCLAYNHDKYIKNTLDGFIKQKTNFKYEVLINDDCSLDTTTTIIEEYEKKYPEIIKPIYQKENQYSKGVDIVEDILIPKAKGEFIAMCEGDDYWLSEEKLQLQYDATNENRNCSICVHKVRFCEEDGSFIQRVIPNESLGIHETGILNQSFMANLIFGEMKYPFQTSSFFVRKEVFEEKNSRSNWSDQKLDINLLQAALNLGDFYYIDKEMSVRRINVPGSWTVTQKRKSIEKQLKHYDTRLEENEKFDVFTEGKYHKYIKKGLYNSVYTIAKIEKNHAKKMMDEYNLTFKEMIDEVGIIGSLKNCIIIYLPWIYKRYTKLLNRQERNRFK